MKSRWKSRNDANIFLRVVRRQWEDIDDWDCSYIQSYSEKVVVDSMAKSVNEEGSKVVVKEVFKGNGSIQALAFSDDGHYMASGHTSLGHEVVIHGLRPKIHSLQTLIGHPRTPLCMTFDPSCSQILFSGCLGGVVNKWNVKEGCLVSTFSSFLHVPQSPINSLVPVHSLPNLMLVATNYAMCLLHTEKLEVVWIVRIGNGLLRLVKHHPQGSMILTAIRHYEYVHYIQGSTHHLGRSYYYPTYSLQLYDLDLNNPPNLNDSSLGLIVRNCIIKTSQCLAMTSKHIICFTRTSDDDLLEIWDTSGNRMRSLSCRDYFQIEQSFQFVDVSPCKRFLLCGQLTTSVVNIYDLDCDTHVRVKTAHEEGKNFGFWMPLLSGHTMDICIGSTSGKILQYTTT